MPVVPALPRAKLSGKGGGGGGIRIERHAVVECIQWEIQTDGGQRDARACREDEIGPGPIRSLVEQRRLMPPVIE